MRVEKENKKNQNKKFKKQKDYYTTNWVNQANNTFIYHND